MTRDWIPRTCQTVYGSTYTYMKCHRVPISTYNFFLFSTYIWKVTCLRTHSCHHQVHQSSASWYWFHTGLEPINTYLCVTYFATRFCTFSLWVKFKCICLSSSKQCKWLIFPLLFCPSKLSCILLFVFFQIHGFFH